MSKNQRERMRFTFVAPQKPLRVKINFLNQINVICPVQSPMQKYFCFPELKSALYSRHPVPSKGAFRDRHKRGAGCGGRRRCF
jgi:hypothetical protein